MTKTIAKFVAVGIINTVFGYSVYALFIFLGMHYSLAALFGTIIGVLFNFKTIGILVFKVNDDRLLIRFIGVYIVTYLMNVSVLKIFHNYRFNMYTAGLLLIVPMAGFSYVLHSKFVFRKKAANATD
jgi:putative flippase GtrA